MSRVTVDLPRVPFTWTRIGTAARALSRARRSQRRNATMLARSAAETIRATASVRHTLRYVPDTRLTAAITSHWGR